MHDALIFLFITTHFIFSNSLPDSNLDLLNRVYREFHVIREDLSNTKLKLNSVESKYKDETLKNAKLTAQVDGFRENNTILKKQLKKLTLKNKELKVDKKNLTTDLELYKSHYHHQNKLYNELMKNKTELDERIQNYEVEKQHSLMVLNLTRSRFDDCIQDQILMACDFELNSLCGFVVNEEDQSTWQLKTLQSLNTSGDFLPKYDHTCYNIKGKFLAITSSNVSQNYGRIYSKRLFGKDLQCLSFYYFVNGKHSGLLNVIIEVPDEGKFIPVWRVYGRQGNIWIEAKLNIVTDISTIGYRIIFEARLEKGNEGIIAVDDINIQNGDC